MSEEDQKRETMIYENVDLARLMRFSNKDLYLKLKRHAKDIAKEMGLTPAQTAALVRKSYNEIQRMRFKIN